MRGAGVSASDLVVEPGAGHGILTKHLARVAGRVVAIELDPDLVHHLVSRFSPYDNVMIVGGDFLELPLPAERFRVFGNIPFGATTSLLRHLLEARAMCRADLIVERGAAMKRTASRSGNVLNLAWGPWWRFTMGKRIPADRFSPPPSVDATTLSVTRREVALLPEQERDPYARFIRARFRASVLNEGLQQQIGQRRWAALTSELGIAPDARPPDINLHQWIGLYAGLREAGW